jgi:hypothetical protein
MTRGKPIPQKADHLRAFAERLDSCASALRAVADEMEALKVKSVTAKEGHRMAYLSVEQYLEKFIQEVRKGLTRERSERGDFGD